MPRPTVAFRSAHASDNGFAPRDGFETFVESDADTSIPRRLESIAAQRGNATALVDGTTRVSYRELTSRTRTIGAALAAELADRPGIVAIHASSTGAAVQALLAVLQAGRAYMVLPASYPEALLEAVTKFSAAVITDADDQGVHPDVPRLRLGELQDRSVTAAAPHARPEDLACVFATSGTTGEPKLVGLSHRAVMFDIGRQINDLFLGPDDRIDMLSHGAFSASLSSIFSALLTGAELHIGPADRLHSLADWMRDSRITISTMTPSTFRILCSGVTGPDAVRDLRLVSLGGETLFDRDVRAFEAAFPPRCVLQNAMASTEARTCAQYFVPRSARFDGPVPVGWPVHRKDLVLVGADGRPVSAGDAGEIVVVSPFLADGYVNDPELTAARFARQPNSETAFHTRDRGRFDDNGRLVFLGRTDALVKIRGHRVEPESIEAVLLGDPRISQAAVVATHAAPGDQALAAFVVTDGSRCTEQDIRGWLGTRMPAYAVPSVVRIQAQLPLTSTGKVDYQRLAATLTAPSPSLLELTTFNQCLAALQVSWASALGRPSAGADDDFFDGGGDSLAALRLQLEVHQRLGCELPLHALLQHRTPRRAAEWLERSATESSLVLLHAGGSGTPLFCVPGIGGEPSTLSHLAAIVGHDRPVYGFRIASASEAPGMEPQIEAIARKYLDDLDAVVPLSDTIHLCGHSFGAVVALEMVHQCHARGRRIGLFAVIDTPLGAGRPGAIGTMRDTLRNLPWWLWYDAFESNPRVLVARAAGKLVDAWQRLRARRLPTSPGRYPDLRAYFGTLHVPDRVAMRVRMRFDAVHRYKRRPVARGVVLFRSRAQALMGRSDRQLGWDRLATAVEVFDVPGHHESCTKPPHVRTLAGRLAARLLREDER